MSESYATLKHTYEDFCLCHEVYSELVLSDDKYEAYRTVSSLNLDQYCKSVRDTYNNAYGSYNEYLAQKTTEKSKQEAKLALNTAKTAEEKLQFAVSNQCDAQPVLVFSQNALSKCKEFFVSSSDNADVNEVGQVISRLEKLILELQCKVHGLNKGQGVSSNFSRRDVLDQSQNVRLGTGASSQAVTAPIGGQPSTPPASAALAVGGGIGAPTQRDGATSNLADFSIVSVFNNKTTHNPQLFSSTVVNTHNTTTSHDNTSTLSQDSHHQCRTNKSRFKEALLHPQMSQMSQTSQSRVDKGHTTTNVAI